MRIIHHRGHSATLTYLHVQQTNEVVVYGPRPPEAAGSMVGPVLARFRMHGKGTNDATRRIIEKVIQYRVNRPDVRLPVIDFSQDSLDGK